MDNLSSPSEPIHIQNSVDSSKSFGHEQSQQANERTSSMMPVGQGKTAESSNAEPISISLRIFQQKLKQAAALKNSGNAAFKQKKYSQAIVNYSQALNHLDPNHFYGATPDECKKMAELSSTLLCNIAFSYFNMQQWYKSDLYFSQAIAINPKYIKALHKRALARFQLSKYEQSFQDIKLAFGLDKTNAQVHTAYKKILAKYNQELKKSKQQMKELSSKIFNKDSIKSQNSIQSPTKKQINKNEAKQKIQENNWTWPKIITLAGAATFIGVSLFKAFKN